VCAPSAEIQVDESRRNWGVKRHGADAAIVAAKRADELLAEGDSDGYAIWKRILEAVSELARTIRRASG